MTQRVAIFIDAGYAHKELARVLGNRLLQFPDGAQRIVGRADHYRDEYHRSGWPLASNITDELALPHGLRNSVKKGTLALADAKRQSYLGAEMAVVCDWLDYEAFLAAMLAERQLLRATVYGAEWPVKGPPAFLRWRDEVLYERLDWLPLVNVKLGKLANQSDSWVQKGVDVAIAVDLTRGAADGLFDVAILVSADNDFVPAVAAALDFGVQVEVVTLGDVRDRATMHLARKADRWRHFSVSEVLGWAKFG